MDDQQFFTAIVGLVCGPLSAIILALVVAIREITKHLAAAQVQLELARMKHEEKMRALQKELCDHICPPPPPPPPPPAL